MARTKGKVTGTAEDGWAQLIIERTGGCGGCQTTHKCHSCLSHAKTEARALNVVGAKTGDLVSVSINTGTLLKSAAILYFLPVVGLLVGAFTGPVVGKMLGLSETGSAILFGFVGLCLGFIFVVFYSRKMSAKNRLTPKIDHIIVPQKGSNSTAAVDRRCQPNLCLSVKA